MKRITTLLILIVLSAVTAQGQHRKHVVQHAGQQGQIQRVLLISIDGMHAIDYLNCSQGLDSINNGLPYCPQLALLGATGVNYVAATTSKPSDSFPGLMSIVTGGTPRSMGVYYDVAYDRSLNAPAKATGNGVAAGPCLPGAVTGTRTEYEEGIDLNQSQLNGGAPGAGLTEGGIASIDPSRLIRDANKGCAPVFPWDFIRTNTIFGVIHNAGGYTAWSDKHPAYASVAGPGGNSLNDYYSPEVNSLVVGLPNVVTPEGVSCTKVVDPSQTGSWTDSFENIKCYDTLKVNAVLNEIDGLSHDGKKTTQVPTIFGMNFQAVSVGQKLIEKNVGSGGYLDGTGTPSAELLREIQFVDDSIGQMAAEMRENHLIKSTLIIITAKHGQSPIDPKRFFPIPGPGGNNGESPATLLASFLPDSESPLNQNGIGPTEDDVSLLWLKDSGQTDAAVAILEENATKAGIGQIFYDSILAQNYNAPGLPPDGDPRTPDIIVTPNVGVVYTGSSKKQMEHGGFAHDDTNVMMLLSNPSFQQNTIYAAVETDQVAPTILEALGLDPLKLDAVQEEGTPVLPMLSFF